MDKQEKLKHLLEKKDKLQKKLEILDERFEEKKENEESWPGHDSTALQQLEQEYQLVITLLKDIEKAIKELEI